MYYLAAMIVLLTIGMIVSLIVIRSVGIRNEVLAGMVARKNHTIETNYKSLENLTAEIEMWKKRTIELEDSISNEGFQVKTRNDITVVNADFTKIEMIVFLSGLDLLMKRSGDANDLEFYISLFKKIQDLSEKMKEEDDNIMNKDKQ